MGMLEEMEALSIKGQPEIRLTRLAAQIKATPCQQGDDSNCSKITGSQIQLPADIIHQIHAGCSCSQPMGGKDFTSCMQVVLGAVLLWGLIFCDASSRRERLRTKDPSGRTLLWTLRKNYEMKLYIWGQGAAEFGIDGIMCKVPGGTSYCYFCLCAPENFLRSTISTVPMEGST